MSEIESETRAAGAQNIGAGEAMPAHWRWNFVANFLDISFFSLALAFASLTTIVPLFIRQLGGSTLLVGLAPALVQLGWVLPPLFVAPYIGRLRRKLPYVLRMTLGERIPWLLLALLTLWLGREQPGLVLAGSVILLTTFGLSGGLAMPAWMDMVASTIPLRMRGKLFYWASAAACWRSGSWRATLFPSTSWSASPPPRCAWRSRTRRSLPFANRSRSTASPP